MIEHLATRTALRPARLEDFDYCARLYFEGMDSTLGTVSGPPGRSGPRGRTAPSALSVSRLPR